MLKLTVYVPVTHLDVVKDAIFAAGAGRVGDYDRCAWQVLGEGQFRPQAGAHPFLGEAGREERVAEYRVETVLHEACLRAVVAALKLAHPYETPAYDVVPLIDI
ncbi:MAG: NGG1p interacting factor NIF3 [Perlucidibaca sp.]